MIRRWGLALILFAWLTSCTASLPPASLPAPSVTTIDTLLPTVTPSYTDAPSSTHKPRPTLTPFPTVTPIFDPHHIQTATPSTPEICLPSEITSTPPPLTLSVSDDNKETTILNYLNRYGTKALLQAKILVAWDQSKTMLGNPNYQWLAVDLTNDGIPDIIYQGESIAFILGCQHGKYQILYDDYYYGSTSRIEAIVDANKDGIPEVAFNDEENSNEGHSYSVFEWDGKFFRNILADYNIGVNPSGSMAFKDIDGDSIQELIVQSGVYNSGGLVISEGPWRNITSIYKWNGSQYVLYQEQQSAPEYRFQAVQDGDRFFLIGEYDRALALYQQAISSPSLKWWSPTLRGYMALVQKANINHTLLPAPPIEDTNDYIVLSDYSYFHILLIDLVKDQVIPARAIEQLIQTRYTGNAYGKAYAEMTNAFWDEYSATQNLYSACQKANAYPEFNRNAYLSYLGNFASVMSYLPNPYFYHGEQSLEYDPENICPFK